MGAEHRSGSERSQSSRTKMSEQSETQEGVIKPKKRFSRTARALKARNGSPAAAPVETGAAADTKKRRENTPGGVLKVTLAIDAIS